MDIGEFVEEKDMQIDNRVVYDAEGHEDEATTIEAHRSQTKPAFAEQSAAC